ncbi:hypothetical protein GGR56DRAFT_291695 [Xylariaceae sp. FL0804]|nr:hypothetical protein GGR56DRAFT_291695 [Xylariaceae sp. FL0804]
MAVSAAGATLSLEHFQHIPDAQAKLIPSLCLNAYDANIPGCSLSDFGGNNLCSGDCVQGLENTQKLVIEACGTLNVNPQSLLGLILQGDLIDTVCSGIQPTTVTLTVAASTTEPTATRQTETSQTSTTTSTTEDTSTTSTSSTTTSSTTFTQVSLTTTQSIATSTLQETTSQSTTSTESSTTTSTTAESTADSSSSTSTSSASATQSQSGGGRADGQGRNTGGGSPFDPVVVSGASGLSLRHSYAIGVLLYMRLVGAVLL